MDEKEMDEAMDKVMDAIEEEYRVGKLLKRSIQHDDYSPYDDDLYVDGYRP